jgi:DNA mismatch endonuclease (patch repair protein)
MQAFGFRSDNDIAMDNLNQSQRLNAMRAVKSTNTNPEMKVRSIVCSLGFTGYRLHRTDIPGKPDLAWLGRKVVLFVNGCFWHGHDCLRGSRAPRTREGYWATKISRNRERDAQTIACLREDRWQVIVVWECELKEPGKLKERLNEKLAAYLRDHPRSSLSRRH